MIKQKRPYSTRIEVSYRNSFRTRKEPSKNESMILMDCLARLISQFTIQRLLQEVLMFYCWIGCKRRSFTVCPLTTFICSHNKYFSWWTLLQYSVTAATVQTNRETRRTARRMSGASLRIPKKMKFANWSKADRPILWCTAFIITSLLSWLLVDSC